MNVLRACGLSWLSPFLSFLYFFSTLLIQQTVFISTVNIKKNIITDRSFAFVFVTKQNECCKNNFKGKYVLKSNMWPRRLSMPQGYSFFLKAIIFIKVHSLCFLPILSQRMHTRLLNNYYHAAEK